MSEEADERYFKDFFKFVGDVMDGKYPYDEIFNKYKVEEILDIISHSVSTTFLTLARMDTEMNFVTNLMNLINFVRTGDNDYQNLNVLVNMYNKMTRLTVSEIYKNVKEISKMGVDEEQQNTFKSLMNDIKEIMNERSDFRATTSN